MDDCGWQEEVGGPITCGMARFEAVMFDLDGTLLDTLAAIANAGNFMLRELGRPRLAEEAFRYLAGQGLRYLAANALGTEDEALIGRGMRAFRAYYGQHGLEETRPYEGIRDVVEAMGRRGMVLAVLSNKPDDATRQAVGHFFGSGTFRSMRGQLPGGALKPDPATAAAIVRELKVPAERWLYVGDTRVDMLTGRAAGMFTVGVTWGFRLESELRDSGARAIIHRPLELLPLLDRCPAPSGR